MENGCLTVRTEDGIYKSTSPTPKGSKFRRFVFRAGHLVAPPHQLEKIVEVLERNWYDSRESLRDLSDDAAACLGVPRELAKALRTEATEGRLLKRYSGPVPTVAQDESDELGFNSSRSFDDLGDGMSCQGSMSASSPTSASTAGPVRRLVRRVGHLLLSPAELEEQADRLEQFGFTSRESLKDLTVRIAAQLQVSQQLAAALKEEATTQRLMKRYAGSVPAPAETCTPLYAVPDWPPRQPPSSTTAGGSSPSSSGTSAQGQSLPSAHLRGTSPPLRTPSPVTRPRTTAVDLVRGVILDHGSRPRRAISPAPSPQPSPLQDSRKVSRTAESSPPKQWPRSPKSTPKSSTRSTFPATRQMPSSQAAKHVQPPHKLANDSSRTSSKPRSRASLGGVGGYASSNARSSSPTRASVRLISVKVSDQPRPLSPLKAAATAASAAVAASAAAANGNPAAKGALVRPSVEDVEPPAPAGELTVVQAAHTNGDGGWAGACSIKAIVLPAWARLHKAQCGFQTLGDQTDLILH